MVYFDSSIANKLVKVMVFQQFVLYPMSEFWTLSDFDTTPIVLPDFIIEVQFDVLKRNIMWISFIKFKNGSTSCMECKRAMYSASVVLKAISACSLRILGSLRT